ncbi:Up-regulated during septation protein [Ceratobasidium sp. AG-Ba]|nr:Up-regulated during septation protein [Ceratobasidium sp. AG-Ba]
MNGIARRLLGGGLGSSSKDAPQPQPEQQPAVAPLALGGAKPPSGSWSTPQAMLASARSMTGRSDDAPPPTGPVDDSTIRQRPARTTSIKGAASVVTSPTAMSPPPSTTTPPLALRAPTNGSIRPVVNTKTFKAPPVQPITKDELLMSLLASEAVVDSRDSEILNAEQVEELKKEDALLQSRYASSTKKLALETKMRDAARSLATLNAQNKSMAKQTQEQLDIASSRFETALADHTRVRDRAVEVQRKLLEHRAGVLSAALRRVEDEQSDGHLSVPSSRMMSPTTATSVTSVSTVSKFDGAHFFAGHADAALPANLRSPLSAADVQALQERVRTAESSANVAAKKAAELGRDLGLLQLEKAEAETTAALEIQQAEEQIAQLRRELTKAERGQAQGGEAWARERAELQEDISQRDKQIEDLQSRIEDLESDANRREPGASGNDEELEAARKALRAIVRSQRITVNTNTTEAGSERQSTDPSSVYSVANMIAAIASHVESLDEGKKSLEKARREVELQLREEQASKENLVQQLGESRQDYDDSLRQIERLEHQMQAKSSGVASVEQRSAELQQLMSVLNALWTILPSPEARASKLTSPPSNPMSPRTTAGPPRTPRTPGPPLISEADIRSLRTLYDPNGPFLSPAPPGKFNIDSFATKVRGLIADDRAIIDRLLKFASTHDLLKTNAEKAQKLAQESTVSLRTYQEQVRTLEDRNNTLQSRQAALLEEIEQLQAAYDEVMEIRAQLEVDAAGQAEVCAHLTEANATLSARALTLAEESANASAPVAAARAKLEAEAVELRKKSAKLEQELERVRNAEQNQRIALLDELNSMQTENTNLRNQIRGLQQR